MPRGWVQLIATLLQNAYLAFPWTRNIYQGPLKKLCTPGLNCYSCPAAVTACPIGTLQHVLGSVRPTLRWRTYRLGFYVVGLLAAVGLLSGRFTCGWLCPFGYLQDLLHRVGTRKYGIPRILWGTRYLVLIVFVLLLPLLPTAPMEYGEAWFCRLLCPAGTLEAAALFPLMPDLLEQIGWVLVLKWALLVAILVWALVAYRPFCRTLCPLGAIYGLFNRSSLIGVEYHPESCRACDNCARSCKAQLDPRREASSPACLHCFSCVRQHCSEGALRIRVGHRIQGSTLRSPRQMAQRPRVPTS